jgi:hypothetical protein
MVVACLALFFAVGGTAIAARHYLINSTGQIKPTVLKALRGNAGPRGLPGQSGPQGSPGPSNASSALTIVQGAMVPVAPEEVGTAFAVCPPGSHAVSGGGSGGLPALETSLMETSHQSWYIIVVNTSKITVQITAVAYCSGAGQAVAARVHRAPPALAVREAGAIAARLRAELRASKR